MTRTAVLARSRGHFSPRGPLCPHDAGARPPIRRRASRTSPLRINAVPIASGDSEAGRLMPCGARASSDRLVRHSDGEMSARAGAAQLID